MKKDDYNQKVGVSEALLAQQEHLRATGLLAEAHEMWVTPGATFALDAYEPGRKRRKRYNLGDYYRDPKARL